MKECNSAEQVYPEKNDERRLKQKQRNVLVENSRLKCLINQNFTIRKELPISEIALEALNYYLDMEFNNFKTILETTRRIRKLICVTDNPPISQVISAGLPKYFVWSLDKNYISRFYNIENEQTRQIIPTNRRRETITKDQLNELQYESAWALSNIASGTSEDTKYIVDLGCIPKFIHLLQSSDNSEVLNQCNWTLGNISGDEVKYRDIILNEGIMPILTLYLNNTKNLNDLSNATWFLSNLMRGKPAPSIEYIRMAIPTLVKLVDSNDLEVLTEACWALSYITDSGNDRIQMFLETVLPKIISFLSLPPYIQAPALRIIGNVVTGNDEQTGIALKHGILQKLPQLLTSSKFSLRKEALWLISNITAGNNDQIKMVIHAGLIPMVTHLLEPNEDMRVKKEGYFTIRNLCDCENEEIINYILDNHAIKIFHQGLTILGCQEVCLEGILGLLKFKKERVAKEMKEYGTDSILESIIRTDEESDVKKLATLILEYYTTRNK